MAIFTKESLENLRQRIDLVDVLSSRMELKRAGAAYKGLCPFHDEKTPSFTVQKGDSHYHCFGCGAHGDAIQFLMTHQKISFTDAVENLAQRFQVPLEKVEGNADVKGPNKAAIKEALEHAARFYHFMLLHTAEGHEALRYLYGRGIDLDFIRHFTVGLAPKASGLLRKTAHAKFIKDETLVEAGLVTAADDKRHREFFADRITFPIRDSAGSVIGFSARKYKEETFGGKYVNTPETPLFKKSRVLFGLNYCRRRIAKEKKAIIVEGQVDALRLIQAGFSITVAGQGTAFGEGHVKELLNLGISHVFLALDSDPAGQEAACKIGNLFQKEGVEVRVVELAQGSDPDSFLRNQGPDAFLKLLEKSPDYLTFLFRCKSRGLNLDSPAVKNGIVQDLIKQIREWEHPLLVHESLRKLAHLAQVPENMVGVGQEHVPNIYIKKSASLGQQMIDPDRVLESDFLRWLLLMGESQPTFIALCKKNLPLEAVHVRICRDIYRTYLDNIEQNRSCDLLSIVLQLDDAEGQLVLSEILQKKVNRERAAEQFRETIQKILDRNWMEAREAIKMRIQSGQCTDDEALALVREFDDLRRNSPKIAEPE